MTNNHVKPWTRLPGESRLWHKRFMKYVLLGPTRSVSGSWRKEIAEKGEEIGGRKKPSVHWYRHFHDDNWEERAHLWDKAELAREESEWRSRRRDLRETEFKMAERLLQRGREILATLTDPESWSLSDAIRAIDLGSKIGRLASELSTESVEVKHHRIPEAQLTEDERIARAHEILRIAEQRRNLGGDE